MTKLYKRDFEFLAQTLKNIKAPKETVKEVCKYLETTNPAFNEKYFLKACGDY